jgi:hypothetical protein
MRPAVVVLAAVAVTALLVLTVPDDRGTTPDQREHEAAEPAEVRATLRRSSLFEPIRALALDLSSGGGVAVDAVRLDSPLFAPLPAEARGTALRLDGAPVTVPVPFGPAVCDDPVDRPTEVVATTGRREVRVAVEEEPAGILASIHDRECAVAAVRDAVELRLRDGWARTADRTAAGPFEVVQRHAGAEATVEEVRGNVIFTVDPPPADGPLAAVDDSRPAAAPTITVSASRCDPHALIEYKRTFIFAAWVALGDGAAVRVDVVAEGSALAALTEVREACLG